jgi:hypothetical protein
MPSRKWPNKARRALVLFRLFLALPGPMFLLFAGTQYSRRDQVAGWTGSSTKLYAVQILGILVWTASTPPLMLSLLLAQIHDTDDANKQKDLTKHVWTWPRLLELALYLVSIYGYFALFFREQLDLYMFVFFFGNFCAVIVFYTFTIVVRSIKIYQEKYESFVRSQAVRVGIITMIMVCVATYALTAMLRVPIERSLLNVFVELSITASLVRTRLRLYRRSRHLPPMPAALPCPIAPMRLTRTCARPCSTRRWCKS